MILCSNPKAQFETFRVEIQKAIEDVLESGYYVLGPRTKAFETEFAQYIGTRHAVGVGSGTEALHLALVALGVGPGDQVITTSHTAVATVAAIELAGATPVLVDIDPQTYTLDPTAIESVVTSKTKAIIPVHLYGQAADMDAILKIARSNGLKVVEDCAQCTGAVTKGLRLGSLADAGCFSFYPTKNLGALGDGGMVVCSDDTLAERLRELREYGWKDRYVSRVAGWNSRLDEMQSAILSVKLKNLDSDNQKRRLIAQFYEVALGKLEYQTPYTRKDSDHVYHLYVIRTERRDECQAFLRENGVGALIHYPVPIHQQPAYSQRLVGPKTLPNTEKAAKEILSLPIYPELQQCEIQKVVDLLTRFASTHP